MPNPFFGGGARLIIIYYGIYVSALNTKIQLSTEQAIQQRLYAEHLQRLAQAIVARMRTGIIVLDKDNKIELMNTAASQLLGATASAQLDNTPALGQLKILKRR